MTEYTTSAHVCFGCRRERQVDWIHHCKECNDRSRQEAHRQALMDVAPVLLMVIAVMLAMVMAFTAMKVVVDHFGYITKIEPPEKP